VGQESILALDGHVITKNHRISVSHSDQHTWNLHLHDVRLADAGWYMCQVNTDPMKVQTSYLDVVGKFECPEYERLSTRKKNDFVTATKLGTTNKFFVASTKNFAAATKRFVGRTKHFVFVTKYFCYPYFNN